MIVMNISLSNRSEIDWKTEIKLIFKIDWITDYSDSIAYTL